MIPLSLAIGVGLGAAAAGAAAYWYYERRNTPGPGAHLSGRIVPETLGSPAPDGLLPKSGYATRDGYEWAYLVGPDDTSGGIAAAITGDDSRYQELLLTNPGMPKIGNPGAYLGEAAWDFDSLIAGDRLLLPVPWSRYIDQQGSPRGRRDPFPPDPRTTSKPMEASAVTAGPAQLPPRALSSAPAPYDRPVAVFGEAA
jgi:hypothetical protein